MTKFLTRKRVVITSPAINPLASPPPNSPFVTPRKPTPSSRVASSPLAEEERGEGEASQAVSPTRSINPPQGQPEQSAGNLSRYFINWKKFTSNSFILNIIEHGYKIQLKNPVDLPITITSPSHEKIPILRQKIQDSLQAGVIERIAPSSSDIVSRVFLVPKPSGDSRMIIDLSQLNLHVVKSSFRMEDKELIKSLLNPNSFLVSIDLKDAFHTISLHQDSRRLTTFEFDNVRYCYKVLPFGLTSSPRIFSKILKSVISSLRSSGLNITHYLDDILLISDSYDLCLQQCQFTLDLLRSLGFVINVEKSCLLPVQRITHLGVIWDTQNMSVSLPEEKLLSIQRLATSCLKAPSSLRTLASLLGKMVSTSFCFKLAPLHYRRFQLNFLSALSHSHDWEDSHVPSRNARRDFSWWIEADLSSITPVSIASPSFDMSVQVDSSLTGWGFQFSSGEMGSGSWSVSQQPSHHINFLELKAIFLTINNSLSFVEGKNLLIESDSKSAVAYINRIGGSCSRNLCFLALELWELCLSHNINILAVHIPGKNNSSADYLSRHSSNHEYGLSQHAFNLLSASLSFSLNIDLFASAENKKLERYVSIFNDEHSYKSDAFSFKWCSNVYAFPPIPMIQKTIHKIQSDEVESCVLITPAWDSLACIPVLSKLLIEPPIFIDSSFLIGFRPTKHSFPWMAWPISGKSVNWMGSRRKWSRPSARVSPNNPSVAMQGCGENLLNGLAQNQIYPKFL